GVGRNGTPTAPVFVQQALQQDQPPPASCDAKPLPDDREVFEANAYIGKAFDNFSPFERDQYLPATPGQPEPGSHSRLLAGVDSRYRLVGDKGRAFQIWLSAFTLHGVRSADVDCSPAGTPSSPLCGGVQDPQGRFLATLEHQTSLEAYFDTRIEFATLQQ